MANIVNQYGQVKVGVRVQSSGGGGGGGIDADAQAFITAASITDSTQQSAINTLVTQLKGYGIWTKLKAVYPFVGGNASAHKFNLKDPRDLDAAFRLTFNGGWTHSSTGALPNGANGYAETYLAPGTVGMSTSSFTMFSYNRNTSSTGTSRAYMGCSNSDLAGNNLTALGWLSSGTQEVGTIAGDRQGTEYSPTTGLSSYSGLKLITTNSNRNARYFKNGAFINNQVTQTKSFDSINIYLSSLNTAGTAGLFNNQEQAFAGISDGLTDAEAANFYTAVQTFQSTLGRQVGVPIVADTDAQAFLNAAIITDQTQASAINTLVTDLKSANIWTKMKAIYPFVGGTASSHKFNLKDPRDLDAAYRLTFNGGWTHSATGALPNGTTGYANTFLTPSTSLALGSAHMSFYSRTNTTVNGIDFGAEKTSNSSFYGIIKNSSNNAYIRINRAGTIEATTPMSNSNVFFIANRASAFSGEVLYVNSTKPTLTNAGNANGIVSIPLFIGCLNDNGNPAYYTNRESAFASIGDGLTDAEATAFYTAVQKYQTSLGRNV